MTSEYPSKHDLAAPIGASGSDTPVSSSGLSSNTKTTRSQRKPQKAADAFRTISEVAKALDVQQHVLRFWETKFSYVKPLKRGGGRRYYRPEDFELLKAIHHMLYTEGYTIKGVQKLLREKGKKNLIRLAAGGLMSGEDTDVSLEPAATQPILAQKPQALLTPNAPQEHSSPFSSQAPALKERNLDAPQKQALRSVLQELKEIRGLMQQSPTVSDT